MTKREMVYPDSDPENADWTKQSWDLPPYGSSEFFDAIGGYAQLENFKKQQVYKLACERGLIHDDEWIGEPAGPAKR